MMKKVWNVISAILVSMIVILAILLVGVRLAGVQPYAVLSGSMSPTFSVGALIYVKPAQPQEVSVGDPITFKLDGTSVVATHRVVRIDAENQCFYTKGDANESPDGQPVTFDHLIGIPAFSIPLLGYISNFITTPPGLFIAIATVLAIVAFSFLPGIVEKAEKSDHEDINEKSGDKDVAARKRGKGPKPVTNVN